MFSSLKGPQKHCTDLKIETSTLSKRTTALSQQSGFQPAWTVIYSTKKIPTKHCTKRIQRLLTQGGYSRFQVTGMIEIFFGGLKFSILGFFWVVKFSKYFFGWLHLSREFWGYSKQSGDSWQCPFILATLSFCIMLLLKQKMFVSRVSLK